MRRHCSAAVVAVLVLSLPIVGRAAPPNAYFVIRVVDQETGRGVPLVELETVNAIRYLTDSNGIVAFHEPGLMDQTVFFSVRSHGYEFPQDGFGYRGVRIKVTPGGERTLKIRRINIAQRLYRITGGGIYRDSILAGRPVPVRHPLINGLVFGQDSVLTARYHNMLYWFWGDTNRPSYPLGNFHAPGATSRLPADGGLDPNLGIDLNYFVSTTGFAKPTAPMPGKGPTWLNGLTVVCDDAGREHLLAHYVKIAKPMRTVAQGIVEFNDAKQVFESRVELDVNAPLVPHGHPIHCTTNGTEYIYFPLMTRVRARRADYLDPTRYETFSCFEPGSREDQLRIIRDATGNAQYTWRRDTIPLTPKRQQKLVTANQLQPHEGWFHLTDVQTGKPITIHARSINWNPYRQRWVMIVCQSFGTSALGEIWYAEADSPIGPWIYARKVVTHDRYSFYNPKQHPEFAQDDGRILFFEGTYTHTFSGNPVRTPRYDYNQIMYKLDLADPRLVLPTPVYRSGPTVQSVLGTRSERTADGSLPTDPIAFYACDRHFPGCVAVYSEQDESGTTTLRARPASKTDATSKRPLFFALPARTGTKLPHLAPLYECQTTGAHTRRYTVWPESLPAEFKRVDPPVCYVWRDPRAPSAQ